MAREISPEVEGFIAAHRVAHLATAEARGMPHVVPVVYVYWSECIYFALDAKPKRVVPERLKRVRNLLENPQVALVIDDYTEDWGRLAYVLLQGVAGMLKEGMERDRALELLREKYPQYAASLLPQNAWVVKITPQHVAAWGLPFSRG